METINTPAGQIATTKRITAAIASNPQVKKDIENALSRYFNGDWGDIREIDKRENDLLAAEHTGKIVAKYKTAAGDIFISGFAIQFPDRDYIRPPLIMFCDE